MVAEGDIKGVKTGPAHEYQNRRSKLHLRGIYLGEWCVHTQKTNISNLNKKERINTETNAYKIAV